VRIDKLGATRGDVRARGDDARGDRGIHREDLILLRLGDEHILHLLYLVRMLFSDILGLAEVGV